MGILGHRCGWPQRHYFTEGWKIPEVQHFAIAGQRDGALDRMLDLTNITGPGLLGKVCELLEQNRYAIGNIDTTLCLEKPKIAPFIPEMQKTLAEVMNIAENRISIKATTNEKMGFVGREEGVACYAVALILEKKDF